ncbi:hypothetical protein [Thermomonospora cellulosilytica]|uniref:Gram-positive cocci surface proteins LPxTG domain-containing protein n=1 Tax=Thermomonospora cellulosilytica TaxID=1411118 RepID=A0A7W3R8S6_9ACTN|nr:hypothetical protein [Thermomonospora cellulosilytica]MBA9004051.1 hypothetical protein [Thermomonospora cellulosilytica]
MRKTFALAGAGAAAAALAFAAPAYAAAQPSISATPNPFYPGDTLTLTATGCTTAPQLQSDSGLFAAPPAFAGQPTTWTAKGKTRSGLTPGKTYVAKWTCEIEGGTATLSLTTTPGKRPGTPKPTPTRPAFSFGYDDVQLSSRRVVPGGSTTFTVTCPTAVTITGNGFTQSPLTVTKVGENTWRGTGTFKQTLPNPTTATVICKDHGAVKYTTDPGDGNGGDMKPKPGTRIPTGPINTGDGTLYLEQRGGDSAMPLMAAGAGAALAAGLGVVVLRRRTARGRS